MQVLYVEGLASRDGPVLGIARHHVQAKCREAPRAIETEHGETMSGVLAQVSLSSSRS